MTPVLLLLLNPLVVTTTYAALRLLVQAEALFLQLGRDETVAEAAEAVALIPRERFISTCQMLPSRERARNAFLTRD